MTCGSTVKPTKVGVIRNMTFFLLSWFCIFSAYGALELLQSSLNTKNGLGVYSISILYGMKALSSLFGPVIVTSLTPKWTLLVGYLCHTVFILCNFYPKWFTMIPASIVLGLVTGPLWICCGIYTTVLGVYYSTATKQAKDAALSKFNGIQGFVISLSVVAGNSVSSAVLKYVTFDDDGDDEGYTSYKDNYVNGHYHYNGTLVKYQDSGYNLSRNHATNGFIDDNEYYTTTEMGNVTHPPVKMDALLCGKFYCPQDHFEGESAPINMDAPHDKTVFILLCALGIFNICGIIFMLLGLQNIPNEDVISYSKSLPHARKSNCQKLAQYVKLFFNWRYLLLTPSITYLYLVLAIHNSTFTKAYITCSVGIDMIGFIAMATGIAMAVTNYISGLLGQCLHRNYLFCFGLIAMLAMYGIMLLWDVRQSSTAILFAIGILFGCANGINMTQFSAFLGAAFTNTKTEAFSYYQFMSGLVMCIGYFLTNRLCARIQIFAALGTMGLAMVTYSILAIHLYQQEREALDDMFYEEDFESNAAKEMEAMIRSSMKSKRTSPSTSANSGASDVYIKDKQTSANSRISSIHTKDKKQKSASAKRQRRKRANSEPYPTHDSPKFTLKDIQASLFNASQHSINQL